MKKINISVVHSGYLDMPEVAQQNNPAFTESAALAYVNAHIDKVVGYFEQAGQSETDLVCTHEDFANTCSYSRDYQHEGLFESLVEKTGPVIRERLSALAKQYNMMIAANNYEMHVGHIYNTSTLYGRDGAIIGQYRKVHLADSENWCAAAGETFDVFPTDIGNIGFMICYDMIFPEMCRSLALNGADIVIHPTQGWGCVGGPVTPAVGEGFIRTRAAENSVYLVVTKNLHRGAWDGGRSMIVNNYGEIITQAVPTEEGVISADIEPDFDMIDPYHFNNFYTGVSGCRVRHLLARRPGLYDTLTDSETPLQAKYKGTKLQYTAEEGKKVMEKWETLSEEERAKYHW